MSKYSTLYERIYRLEQLLYESKADQDLLLKFLGDEYYNKYVGIKNKINNPEYKDIYRMIKKDPNEVKNYIDSFQSNRSNRQQDKEGAELIYNKDGWKVYHITTYEAAKFYGRHTKWCIAGNYAGHEDEGRAYFNSYMSRDDLDGYYFYIKSDNEKYCVLKRRSGKIEDIYNSADFSVDVADLPEDFPSIQGVLSITSAQIKELLYSDEVSDVEQAISAGAEIDFIDENGETPLCNACVCDATDVAKLLLKHGANPNVKDVHGNRLITIACDNSNTELAQLLYEHGANINSKSSDGFNIATSAITRDDDDILLWVLSKDDFNINGSTANNGTPLMCAILEDKMHYIKLLLKHGADPNAIDSQGNSMLHAAVIEDRPELAKLLLKAGASKSIKDKYGKLH